MNHCWRREKPQRTKGRPVRLMPEAVKSFRKDLSVVIIVVQTEQSLPGSM